MFFDQVFHFCILKGNTFFANSSRPARGQTGRNMAPTWYVFRFLDKKCLVFRLTASWRLMF